RPARSHTRAVEERPAADQERTRVHWSIRPSPMSAHSRTTTIANGVGGAFRSATEMVRSLRAREISASELLALHIERIARHNPALNAIVTPDFERAAEAARAIDAAPAAERGSLCGLPLTIKDNLDVMGIRTTAGLQA